MKSIFSPFAFQLLANTSQQQSADGWPLIKVGSADPSLPGPNMTDSAVRTVVLTMATAVPVEPGAILIAMLLVLTMLECRQLFPDSVSPSLAYPCSRMASCWEVHKEEHPPQHSRLLPVKGVDYAGHHYFPLVFILFSFSYFLSSPVVYSRLRFALKLYSGDEGWGIF